MAGPKKFGTFGGVYTPSVLTILGVIMYMRLGWVVGEAGLYAALAIIILSHVISITTGLSISSIATDKKIKSGGIYYLLSRSLGFPMGGAIGITLFVGTALSIALYIIGFSESFLGIQAISDFLGLQQDINSYRILGTGILLLLVILAFISTSLAIKSQFFILGAIALSIISIIIGVFTPSDYSATAISTSAFPEHVPLITVFAIFFPAVTGFTAGVAMSGDLKDPKSAIPKGTLWSIATGLVVYIGLAILFAALIDRNLLVNDKNFLLKIAWSAPLVIAGIWGATLSSALGGILGGPRIIQAVAIDKIVPKFLAKGTGESNEPRNALIFTFFLAEAGILIGELDAIAEIVSMFYIAAYGFINLAFALESWASTDFRPTFKISKWIGIIGFIASFGVMFQLNPAAMFAAFIIMWVIYFILKRKELKSESGDVWSSVWTSVARTSLTKLQEKQIEERNWKPNILLFSGDNKNREHLLVLGKAFIGKFGFLSVFDLTKKTGSDFNYTRKEQNINPIDNESNAAIFQRQHSVNDIYEGISQISATYGFSGVEPNTVMLGWARNTDEPEKVGRLIRNIYQLDLNLVMMDYDKVRKLGSKSKIDIWWIGSGQNGNLSLQLIKFLWQDESWSHAKLRLMIVNPVNSERDNIHKEASIVLNKLRIEAEIKIINNQVENRSFYDIVQTESVDSDLIFMGIPDIEEGQELKYIHETNHLCENIGTVILVKASSFFKALNIGHINKKKQNKNATLIIKEGFANEIEKSTNATINILLKKLDDKLDGFSEEFKAHIASLMNVDDVVEEKTKKILKKMIMNLSFAANNSTAEVFKNRLSVIESKVLNDLTQVYLNFSNTESSENDNSIKQKAMIEEWLQFTKSSINQFIKELPISEKIKYSIEDMNTLSEDSSEVKFYKWRHRLLGKLGLKYTNYRLYLKRIVLQEAAPEIYKELKNIAKEIGSINYSYYIGLQSFTTKLDFIFQEIKNESSADKIKTEYISEKINELETIFTDLNESYENNKKELFKVNQNFRTHIINIISRIIGVTHPNALVDEEINTLSYTKKLTSDFDDIPQKLYQNKKLLINNLILNNAVLLAKNKLIIDTFQVKKLVSQEITAKVTKNQEIVLQHIEEFYREYQKSKKAKPVFNLDINSLEVKPNTGFAEELINKSQKRLKKWLEILPNELEIFDEESFNILTSNQFDAISSIKISVKQMMDFMIEKEFMLPIQKVLDEIPTQITYFNKALHDHIRLIEYTITHDNDILPDETENNHIQEKVEETKVEIENTQKYLQDTLHKIDVAATSAVNLMAIYPFLKASLNMKQYIKDYRDTKRKNKLNRVYTYIQDTLSQQFAKLVYGQSSGILFTKSLFANAEAVSTSEQLLADYWKSHISKEVYGKLPFYYKHLFLRKQNYSIDFLTGRESEIAKMDQYINNYRNGFKKALLIKGDRHSGKSFISNILIDRHFNKENVYTIQPPEAGSTHFNDFRKAVQISFDNDLSIDQNFRNLSTNSLVIIEDFELWWERKFQSEATAQKILDLVQKYQEQITFIIIMNSLSHNIINKIIPMESYFSGVVDCGAMNSEEIGRMILTRHKIGNLKFQLKGKSQDNFHTWNYAKLFNKYFAISNGNPGLCLQMWINNIEEVYDKTIVIRTPHSLDNSNFEGLTQKQTMALLNMIIHNAMNVSKLMRLMEMNQDEAKNMLNDLISMGLVIKNANGIYKLDRINYHRVVKYFKQNNIL